MQSRDPEVLARNERVQELCRQLGRLLTLSRAQRQRIEALLAELQAVTRRAASRPAVRAAGAGRGSGTERR
jgi:hypothetical protein